ncbi:hypothetical protein sos41_38570 [Alphaproteobacteria bacterium SO-S41]|nr:hypothetical protein sos41_38570 [Alphaproteobacteria bacterium SO-S41]
MTTATPDFAPDQPLAREPAVWAAAFGLAALAGCAAVAVAPLAAYVWLIALFGIPHVVAEMRYCDERFSGRSSRLALGLIGAILLSLATVRVLGTYGVLSGSLSGPLELILGGMLAFAAAFFMRRFKLLGFAIAALVAFGALYYPLATFLIWAWLHNLTPLGFVADALPRHKRLPAIALLCIPFFVVPAFVALGGLDWIALTLFSHDATQAGSAFGAGLRPLQSFLPSRMALDDAIPLFQAAVVSQVMHYVAVIALMPRLLKHGAARDGRLAPWPSWPVFYGLLAVAGLASTAFYAIDFGEARSAYALAAALHSWIELPIFLMALGGGFSLARPGSRTSQSLPAPTPH